MIRIVFLFPLFAAAVCNAQTISHRQAQTQEVAFTRLWGEHFDWTFENLPTAGNMHGDRTPYSGYIYLDKDGGTADVLRKYDAAFHGRQGLATDWERRDSSQFRERQSGLLGILGITKRHDWYGHCNGWTAAAIRHAEPQQSVSHNGVTFSPSDIKGLLAELYTYNRQGELAGFEEEINAGTLHAILANWIGRKGHPLGMDVDPGEEKWNYPVYSFASSFGKISSNVVAVNTNLLYALDTEDREYDESPKYSEVMSLSYTLTLDAQGRITGGRFTRDSEQVDFVWVPLSPRQAGEEGNERGNPHVNVDAVLSLWRQSVSKSTRDSWVCVEPESEELTTIHREPRPLADL